MIRLRVQSRSLGAGRRGGVGERGEGFWRGRVSGSIGTACRQGWRLAEWLEWEGSASPRTCRKRRANLHAGRSFSPPWDLDLLGSSKFRPPRPSVRLPTPPLSHLPGPQTPSPVPFPSAPQRFWILLITECQLSFLISSPLWEPTPLFGILFSGFLVESCPLRVHY